MERDIKIKTMCHIVDTRLREWRHVGPYGDAWKAEPLTYYHNRRCDTGVESDVYECLLLIVIVIFCLHLK